MAIDQGSDAIFDALLAHYPNLLDELTVEEKSGSLCLYISRNRDNGQGGHVAIRLIQAGANPFFREQPNNPSALESAIVSQWGLNGEFFNVCYTVEDDQIAVANIGFKELRIAAELDHIDLWRKLSRFVWPETLRTETDEDNWTLGHIAHQSASQLPIDIRSNLLPTSFLSPRKLVVPEFWRSPDRGAGARFELCDDGVSVSFPCTLPYSLKSTVLTRNLRFKQSMFASRSPISAQNNLFTRSLTMYFEVSILSNESPSNTRFQDPYYRDPVIDIGLCGEFSDLSDSRVGWRAWSVGYHGDDGAIYEGSVVAKHPTAHTFRPGDTVGCGISYSSKEYLFTRGGKVIGTLLLAPSYFVSGFALTCIQLAKQAISYSENFTLQSATIMALVTSKLTLGIRIFFGNR